MSTEKMKKVERIAAAIAFSPRFKAMVAESLRLQKLLDAELLLVHIGEESDEQRAELEALERPATDTSKAVKVIVQKGDPANRLLAICRSHKVDLLLAGALKRENLYNYYIGSTARKIMRRSSVSVLLLVEPSEEPSPFETITINAGDTPINRKPVALGLELARASNSRQVHILKTIKMMGLTMAMAGESTEEEYMETRKKLVNDELEEVMTVVKEFDGDQLRINVKVMSGKVGHETRKFTRRVNSDLLVLEGANRKLNFLDRMFTNELEYIFSDLPSNLLVVH